MDKETMEMVVNAARQLGIEARTAFVWWIVLQIFSQFMGYGFGVFLVIRAARLAERIGWGQRLLVAVQDATGQNSLWIGSKEYAKAEQFIRSNFKTVIVLAALLPATPAHAATLHVSTTPQLSSALGSAATGDTIRLAPGTYGTFPNPARDGVTVIGAGTSTVVPGGGIWRSGTTIEDVHVRGTAFNLDNWAGVSNVTLRRVTADLRNPGSTAFLMRWQPEGDARIRGLKVEDCRFTMTLPPGQPLDQKVWMFNRCVGTRAYNSTFLIRDSTGQGGSSVRQGILFRDGLVDNLFDTCSLLVRAVHPNGQGYTGLDLTSSGNTIPGGGNRWVSCVIVNETDAYTQFQWCMQDGDHFSWNKVTSRQPFRISGVRGDAYFGHNTITSTGNSGVALIYGGSGITSGHLRSEFNLLVPRGGAAKSGVSYESTAAAWDSEWNFSFNATRDQDVMVAGVRQSFAQACARIGRECGSTAQRTKGPVMP